MSSSGTEYVFGSPTTRAEDMLNRSIAFTSCDLLQNKSHKPQAVPVITVQRRQNRRNNGARFKGVGAPEERSALCSEFSY